MDRQGEVDNPPPPKKIKVCKQTENNDSQQEFLFILVTVLNEMD